MKEATLYFFKREFFSDKKSVFDFISKSYKEINEQRTDEDKNSIALAKAFVTNALSTKTKDIEIKYKLLVCEANLLQFVGYRTDDLTLISQALKTLDTISQGELSNLERETILGYFLTKGEANIHYYIFSNKRQEKTSTIENMACLFEAKKCFSFLFNEFLKGTLPIDSSNTQKIIINYCQTLGYLSRYVEPSFLFDRLVESSTRYKWSVDLGNYLLLEAIKDKTCNSINPLVLIKLQQYINSSLTDEGLDKRNISVLEESKIEIEKQLKDYKEQYGKTKEDLEIILNEGNLNAEEYPPYTKFIIKNKLGLNEHGLYCICQAGIRDNLSIYSPHKHTQIEWVKEFEIILNQIKNEFDSARRSYYRAVNNDSALCDVIENSFVDNGVLFSPKVSDLTNSFKGCFSILDKIAIAFNLAFSIVTEESKKRNIHFHTFFKRNDVKKMINSTPNNLFAIALFSISQDLDKDSKYGEFHEYKDWRNAAEHNYLMIVKENAKISSLETEFPNVNYFIREKEFEEKTLYLLHLCRSAIYSFTWVIRKASINQSKKQLS